MKLSMWSFWGVLMLRQTVLRTYKLDSTTWFHCWLTVWPRADLGPLWTSFLIFKEIKPTCKAVMKMYWGQIWPRDGISTHKSYWVTVMTLEVGRPFLSQRLFIFCFILLSQTPIRCPTKSAIRSAWGLAEEQKQWARVWQGRSDRPVSQSSSAWSLPINVESSGTSWTSCAT